MVIGGAASDALIDSYDAERRPVGVLTMQQALARFGSRMGPGEGQGLITRWRRRTASVRTARRSSGRTVLSPGAPAVGPGWSPPETLSSPRWSNCCTADDHR